MASPGTSQPLTCGVCTTEFTDTPFNTFVVSEDVEEFLRLPKAKQEQRKLAVSNLVKKVNALLNSGGGVLFLHVHTEMGPFLSEQLDTMLMKIHPDDGTRFADNYEKNYIDSDHMLLRVKARERTLSTFDFKTKTSTDTGLEEVTYQQMKKILSDLLKPQQPNQQQQQNQQQHPNPLLNEEKLEQGMELETFHESAQVEAKSVEYMQGNNDGSILADHAWTDLKLPEKITSFSKEDSGGYYFLGIGEEKDNQRRTVVFLCEGVPLPLNEHDKFKDRLLVNISDEMLWCRGPDMKEVKDFTNWDQVTVSFRQLDQSGRNIIEVMVKTFYGLCFTDPRGPEAYEFEHPSNPANSEPLRISFKDWLKHQPSTADVAVGV